MTVRYHCGVSERGVFTGQYVVDNCGKYLQQVLSEAYQDVDSISFSGEATLLTSLLAKKAEEQLKLLFYERDTFRKRQRTQESENPGRTLVLELGALVNFVEGHFSSTIYELSQLPQGRITYDLHWTLFRPNSEVLGVDEIQQERVYRVKSSGYDQEPNGGFTVACLGDVEWNDDIVDLLALSNECKDFIQALFRPQQTGSGEDEIDFDNFVHNKDKGLVGLLAGSSVVGKTLTAEVVSEIAHRPLYVISSGELGERNAMLPLDEVDAFSSESDNMNLTGNAITSIFLRHLEYYQGILLFTTNRLSSTDSVLESRIHFCFEY
ncbi:hypothetical protein ETB97_007634 [Aspergillus alliaceus]|uniref:DUF7025 domain-containing protein n=1 Tax=Petromyces alliaceus TaxID=209559 RepID=A0A8H6E2M4_PETAA|nr:hypothetical protein ETB97_007634 [Aspergillus burnettii]